MNDVQKSYSLSSFADELIYLEACLKADSETVHVVQEVSDELTLLDEQLEDARDIHRQGVLGRAKLKVSLRRVEKCVREVYAAMLFKVRQDRKDVLYQKLFKYDLTSVLRMSPQTQLQELLRVKSVLGLAIYDDEFRDAQSEVIDGAIAELNGVLEMRKQEDLRQMHHRLEVEQCKDRVNNVRGSVYGELLKISRAKNKGKAWARGFFQESNKTKKLSAEEIAKKNVARAKRASEKATAAAEVAAETSRRAEEKSKVESDKVALDEKSNAELEEAAKETAEAKERIRRQLEDGLRVEIEAELALEKELVGKKLNGVGDSA